MYVTDPESRTFLNGVFTAAGVLPLIPAASQMKKGIKAYHGSPHDFDKFSMDNIGTGEGAQAYGHGLYFAEAEGTAKSYRDALTDVFVDGKKLTADEYSIDGMSPLASLALRARNGNVDDAIEYATTKIDPDVAAELSAFDRSRLAKDPGHIYEVNLDVDPDALLDWDAPISDATVDALKAKGIDEVMPKMWAIEDFRQGQGRESELTGRRLWETLNLGFSTAGGTKPIDAPLRAAAGDAAGWLRDAGLPGIKYFDEISREGGNTRWLNPDSAASYHELTEGVASNYLKSAGGDASEAARRLAADFEASGAQQYGDAARALSAGDLAANNTRNIVMFDDSLISIAKKYGLPLTAAGMAAAARIQSGESPNNLTPESL